MVSLRFASGSSNEVIPVGVVIRQTAVPDFIPGPNLSHTKRYLPPAVDCVRCTIRFARLHSTFIASRALPDSSTIRSGVMPIHQFGGSTLVTAGALLAAGGFCSDCAAARAEKAGKNPIATEIRARGKIRLTGLRRGPEGSLHTSKA